VSGLDLREHQIQPVEKTLAALKEGARALGVAPTGIGKTVIAAHVISRFGGRSLTLIHREELVEQTLDKLRMVGLSDLGVVKAERDETGAQHVVASIQTLAHAQRRQRLGRDFALVWTDEAHHAAAPSYLSTLDDLGCFPHPHDQAWGNRPALFGTTATPDRLDKLGLASIFDKIVFEIQLLSMIRAGYLADIIALRIVLPIDLDGVHVRGGDLVESELAAAYERVDAPRRIASAFAEHAATRKAAVFVPGVKLAHATAAALRERGFVAEALDGSMRDERPAILARLASGETQIVTNCQVLTEGWDSPSVDCIVMARPTQSRALYQQIVGRGLRPYPNKANCLAEGQRVLTDQGLVCIEQVTPAMRVWDGVEFVSHDGAVCRGEQEVITYAGLTATPDHKVWTRAGWTSFAACAAAAIPIAVTGASGRPLREIDGYRRRSPNEERSPASAHALYNLRRPGTALAEQLAPTLGRLPRLRTSPTGTALAHDASDRRQAALHEPERQGLSALWGSWNRVPFHIASGDGALGSNASRSASGAGARPDRQPAPLRGGQPPLRHAGAEPGQQPKAAGQCSIPRISPGAPGDPLRGCDAADTPSAPTIPSGDRGSLLPAVEQAKRRVWDLLNAGPRHRFTVEGLLVSNCLVLDLVGNSDRHDLVTTASLLGLDPRLVATEGVVAAAEDREQCLATVERQRRDGLLRGQAQALMVDLLARRPLLWTSVGAAHLISLGFEHGWVAIEPSGNARWRVLRLSSDWNPRVQVVHDDLDFGYATGIAEDVARQYVPEVLRDRDKAWRAYAPSPKQINQFAKKGWALPTTRGAALDFATRQYAHAAWTKARK
jgi:superfamily II DNA or RNA helicase